MRNFIIFMFAASIAFALSGCGGSGGSARAGSAKGSLTFTVKWPKKGRLIPYDSTYIVAVLTDASGATVGTQDLSYTNGAAYDSVTFSGVDAGAVTLTATAYPDSSPGAVAQATGSAPSTIVAGQTASVTVTMADTIDHLAITPANPTVRPGYPVTLTMTAYDATNEVVLTSSHTISWVSESPSIMLATPLPGTNQCKVSSEGVPGSSTIQVTENESDKTTTTVATNPSIPNQPYYVFGDVNSKYVYCLSLSTTNGQPGQIDEYGIGANGTLTPLSTPSLILPSGYNVSGQERGRAVVVDPAGTYIFVAIQNPSSSNNMITLTVGPGGVLSSSAPYEVAAGTTDFITDSSGKHLYFSNNYGFTEYTVNADGSLTAGQTVSNSSSNATTAGGFIPGTSYAFFGAYEFMQNADGTLTDIGYFGPGDSPMVFTPNGKYIYIDEGTSIQLDTLTFNSGQYYISNSQTVYQESTSGGYINDLDISSDGKYMFLRDYHFDNLIHPFQINSDGTLTPVTPAGTVPSVSSSSVPTEVTYSTPNVKYLYNPDITNGTISQFAIGSNGGLTPLSPATVPAP